MAGEDLKEEEKIQNLTWPRELGREAHLVIGHTTRRVRRARDWVVPGEA